jgi:hypothetical protein
VINPEQVSSYQVAPTFCNKSILSNPKLLSNFLNAELVKPRIRKRVWGEERRGKSFVPLAGRIEKRKRRTRGCCRSLLKRWSIKYDILRTQLERGTVGYIGPLVHFSTQGGIIQTGRAVPSTCEVRPQTSKPPRATILWRQTARTAQRGFYTTRLQSSKRCCLRCAFQTFLYISCKRYIYIIYINKYRYLYRLLG